MTSKNFILEPAVSVVSFEDFLKDQESIGKKKACHTLQLKTGYTRKTSDQNGLDGNRTRLSLHRVRKASDERNDKTQLKRSSEDPQEQARRKRPRSDDVVIVAVTSPQVDRIDKVPEPLKTLEADSNAGMLWTDKYQPTCASPTAEGSIRTLLDWLKVWRERVEKLQDEVTTKVSSKYSDDYDFQPSHGGYDIEDDTGIYNTMVISGPTGCGKTSTVYACAKEAGFKVLELNASTLRSGKSMLAQLQEATQSHLVSKANNEGSAKLALKNKPSNSKSIKNFFCPKVIKPEKKRCKGNSKSVLKEPKPTDHHPVNKEASLILIDELDAVLHPDVGFWAGLQTLMSTSKRPIVLTASNASDFRCLDRDYKKISLKQLTETQVGERLRGIARDEAVLSPDWLSSDAADVARGDIRQAILSLQFWCAQNNEEDKASKKKKRKQEGKAPAARRKWSPFHSRVFGVASLLDGDFLQLLHDVKTREDNDDIEKATSHLFFHNLHRKILKNPVELTLQPSDISDGKATSLKINNHVEFRGNGRGDWTDDADLISLAFNRRSDGTEASEETPAQRATDGSAKASVVRDASPESRQEDAANLNGLSAFMEVLSECDQLQQHLASTYPHHRLSSAIRDGTEDDTGVVDEMSHRTWALFSDTQAALNLRGLKAAQSRLTAFDQSAASLSLVKSPVKLPSELLMNVGRPSLHADVMPCLRAICRAEERRKEAKSTRRSVRRASDDSFYSVNAT